MTVVSNTSPLNYLAWIGEVERLQDLYGNVVVPPAVIAELQANETPMAVRSWLASSPSWLEVRAPSVSPDPLLDYLGRAEREAMELALQLRASALKQRFYRVRME